MADFIKLCKTIIDSRGHPTVNNVLECGYSMEHFIKMSQPDIKADKLLKNARQALIDRGIHYKEELK